MQAEARLRRPIVPHPPDLLQIRTVPILFKILVKRLSVKYQQGGPL